MALGDGSHIFILSIFSYNLLMVKDAKTKLTTVVFVLSVLLGIAIIVVPMVIGAINQARSDEAIRRYNEQLAQQEKERAEQRFAEADEYNRELSNGEKDAEKYAIHHQKNRRLFHADQARRPSRHRKNWETDARAGPSLCSRTDCKCTL